jgi:uncharacterized Zn finger protein (UPF0148 family)
MEQKHGGVFCPPMDKRETVKRIEKLDEDNVDSRITRLRADWLKAVK